MIWFLAVSYKHPIIGLHTFTLWEYIVFVFFQKKKYIMSVLNVHGRILAVIQRNCLCSLSILSCCLFFLTSLVHCRLLAVLQNLWHLARCLVVPAPVARSERLPFWLYMVFVCPVKLSSLCVYICTWLLE